MKDFTLNDLENGMVIEYRDKDRALVLGGKLIGRCNWTSIMDYKNNLNHDTYCDMDIVKVFVIKSMKDVTDLSEVASTIENDDYLELIWKETIRQYTYEELKEILGHEFEIVDIK